MHPSLQPYEDRVAQGLLRKVTNGPLVLYNYTDQCTFERAWDQYTRSARGIIFEAETGKCIARPFPKFFNLGELPETSLANLPAEPYSIWEKADGSLGILYYYDGKWNVATRGSFTSVQAIEGAKLLEQYDMRGVPTNLTVLVEIIYPENKIIVNYGDTRELVLLGIRSTEFDVDMKDITCHNTGMRFAKRYWAMNIEEAIALQKMLSKDEEGFVVHYESGLRVKIKGEEYLKIAKILSHLSPLSFWEVMKDGKVQDSYLMQIPEEFRKEWEPIKDELEATYNRVVAEVSQDCVFLIDKGAASPRDYGLLIKAHKDELQHPNGVFPSLTGKLDRYVMKTIRPTGNVLK